MAEKKNQVQYKGKKTPPSNQKKAADKSSFAYQLVPYIFAVIALFLLLCFITNAICNPNNSLSGGNEGDHALGYVGFWICQILFGILGPAAYIIPIILACFVVFWKNYNRRDYVAINAVIAVITAIVLSSLLHILWHVGEGAEGFSDIDIGYLFEEGAQVKGGGIIGGVLSFGLVAIMNVGGAIFVLVAALFPLVTFLLGTTPVEVVAKIAKMAKTSMERSSEIAKEKKEAKALELKEIREEERLERAAIREEERLERAAQREADRLEREPARHAAKEEARIKAENEKLQREQLQKAQENQNDEDAFVPLDMGNKCRINIIRNGTQENNANDEDHVQLSAFTSDEIRHMDEIKTPIDNSPKEIQFEDEDEQGAADVFSYDENDDEDIYENDSVVFVNPLDEKKARGVGTLDDMASELFDEDAELDVDEETGEVFTPVVQSKKAKSAAEFEAENNPRDEYFIGDKPEPYVIPEYKYPPVDLLQGGSSQYSGDADEIEETGQKLLGILETFKISVDGIDCSCGPTVTRYEIRLKPGVRVRAIANLVDDISYGLAKSGVRIETPIPGKMAVGIEVPNDSKVAVKLRNLIENPEFVNHKSTLASCLGADVAGKPVIFDIEKMPHLLVAGTTGSGKSVCINSIIMSILYHAKPEEVKLLLIDPKKVEFKIYKDIPHLCCRIISDPKKAAGALNSAVNEMEKRFALIEEVGVRNISAYNEITKNDPEKPYMPRLVIIIDEFADLMMSAKDEVETAVVRIAQKARAAGIHLIIGTQRPSVDVITGLIKANIPSRIAFTVMSGIDSRTILDTVGAEKLCGRGDMLYAPVGAQKPQRVQGAFVSDEEVEAVVNYVKANNAPVRYDQEFESSIDVEAARCGQLPEKTGGGDFSGGSGDEDSKFWDAVELAVDCGKISTSLLQRRLEVGYGRAAKIIDRMEEMGFVSEPDGNKPRKILITAEELAEKRMG